MSKITWDDRTNSGSLALIDAAIFNDTKTSVNSLYDVVEARIGTTSSADNANLTVSGTIYVSGSIIPNADDSNTSSFDLGSETAAWKDIYVSDGSIRFVKSGETTISFTKEEVSKLQSGKSISKTVGKQLVNENDDTTYVRMSSAGRATHYAGNNVTADFKSDQVTIGALAGATTGLPLSIPGGITGSTSFTGSIDNSGSFGNTGSFDNSGSFENTGSFNSTGSFAINNLLDLLSNFSSSGLPTGSDSEGVNTGDINLDGQVNINDLLLVLSGYGNPNTLANDVIIPPNVNHQYIGPTITILHPVTMSISTGSFVSITF